MPHSSAFRATNSRYVAIPSSFFAHASSAGQSIQSSRPSPGQSDRPPATKMSFASQQAARLAQQRIVKQKEAMTIRRGTILPSTGSSTRVSWPSSSSSTHSYSTSSRHSSTSSLALSSSSLASQVISQTVETLRNMEDRLDDLLSKFQIPDQLDFISTHLDPQYSYYYSQNGPLTHLSITAQNRPVIALGELLSSLEQELGFVEVNGINGIEVHKKNVANRIKETAEDLEKRVHDLWWSALSKKASNMHSITAATAVPRISSDLVSRKNSSY